MDKRVSVSRFFNKCSLVEYLLAVLFLIAPFYYRLQLGGGLEKANNITVWIVVLIITFFTFFLVLNRKEITIPKHFILISGFPVFVLLSGFIAGTDQPIKWMFKLLFIWGGLVFFLSLFQYNLKQGRKDNILFIIVISALLHSVVAVMQIWLKNDMPIWLPPALDGQPRGLFNQINNHAVYQATAVMITLYLITRPAFLHGGKKNKLLLLLTVALASFIITMSGSRIGILTLTLGLLMNTLALWTRFRLDKKMFLAVMSAIAIAGSIGFSMSQGKLIEKTLAINSGYSGAARIGIYKISVDLIAKKPFRGHGIGSFTRVWQNEKENFYTVHPGAKLPSGCVNHPHNEILLWLVEGGIVAGVGFILMLVAIVVGLKQAGWRRGTAYAAMLLPIMLHTQVELPFTLSAIMWFLFLTMLALFTPSFYRNKINIVLTQSATILSKIVVCFLAILCTIFLLHTLKAQSYLADSVFYGHAEKVKVDYALHNPYLRSTAVWIEMNDVMIRGIKLGKYEMVEAYIKWGEEYLVNEPHITMFHKLAEAYSFLGKQQKLCVLLNRGLSIYPEDIVLNKWEQGCKDNH